MTKSNNGSSVVTNAEKISDHLAAVRQAEEQAAQIKRAAVTTGAGIITDAERKCAEMIEKARDDAETSVSKHAAECERISKSKLSNEAAKAERRADAVIEKAMQNFDKAVERVVRGVTG